MAKNPFPKKSSNALDHDFSNDELRPKDILDHLKAHDERMRSQASTWALAKAMYCTAYWKYMREGGTSPGSDDSDFYANWVDIEVNRIFPIVGSYLAALYPRAQRAIVGRDPAGRGDPEKTKLTLNRWLSSKRIHQRVMTGIRQGIIYPGSGAKVGYDPGYGNPLDRVWMRIIPWWELVLDFDVNDVDDQRFVGHAFYQSRKKIENRYNLKDKLKGLRRVDFLESHYGFGPGPGGTNAPSSSQTGSRATAAPDEQAFVRMLEVCNLVDAIEDEHGNVYMGRLEIYVMGQDSEISSKPVYMGPLPFASYDGTPAPHISPLIFNYEPEYPLRGIPHSARVLPQCQELNSYRALMAMQTRKDTRQYVTRKGTFTSDDLGKLAQGVEGLILELPDTFERPIVDAIVPIQQGLISTNIDRYLGYVEHDLERTVAQSPQARGEITKATAFEVQTVLQYTESEFGMHAAIKDDWLGSVLHLALFALKAAMQDTGDSAGGYDEVPKEDMGLSSVGALEQPQSEPSVDQEKSVVASEIQAKQAPVVDQSVVPETGEFETTKKDLAIVQKVLTMQDERGNAVTVEVKDLDGAFDISFVEGGRTPLTDAAMQQALLVLLQPYMQLWDLVQKGGPQAVLAKAYMQIIAERYDLPRDLHPSELAAKAADAAEAQAQPGAPEEAPPQGPQDLPALIEKIRSLPPAEAIDALSSLLASSPEMVEVLKKASQLPPDQQAAVVSQILDGLGQTPPQQQPPQSEQQQVF